MVGVPVPSPGELDEASQVPQNIRSREGICMALPSTLPTTLPTTLQTFRWYPFYVLGIDKCQVIVSHLAALARLALRQVDGNVVPGAAKAGKCGEACMLTVHLSGGYGSLGGSASGYEWELGSRQRARGGNHTMSKATVAATRIRHRALRLSRVVPQKSGASKRPTKVRLGGKASGQ